MTARWAEPYVGLPFVDGGRTMAGVDCWERARIILPSHDVISAYDLVRVASQVRRGAGVLP